MRKPTVSFHMLGKGRRAYVYAIQCGEFIKVGVTRNPAKRMQTMMLHNPHELTVALYRTVRPRYAYAIEKRMHEMLAPWWHRGEWFTASLEEVRKAAKVAIGEAEKLERARVRKETGEPLNPIFGVTDVESEDEFRIIKAPQRVRN